MRIHQKSIWRFSEGALQTPGYPENGEGPRLDTGGLLHAVEFLSQKYPSHMQDPGLSCRGLERKAEGTGFEPADQFTKNQSDVFQASAFDHSATPPFGDP